MAGFLEAPRRLKGHSVVITPGSDGGTVLAILGDCIVTGTNVRLNFLKSSISFDLPEPLSLEDMDFDIENATEPETNIEIEWLKDLQAYIGNGTRGNLLQFDFFFCEDDDPLNLLMSENPPEPSPTSSGNSSFNDSGLVESLPMIPKLDFEGISCTPIKHNIPEESDDTSSASEDTIPELDCEGIAISPPKDNIPEEFDDQIIAISPPKNILYNIPEESDDESSASVDSLPDLVYEGIAIVYLENVIRDSRHSIAAPLRIDRKDLTINFGFTDLEATLPVLPMNEEVEFSFVITGPRSRMLVRASYIKTFKAFIGVGKQEFHDQGHSKLIFFPEDSLLSQIPFFRME